MGFDEVEHPHEDTWKIRKKTCSGNRFSWPELDHSITSCKETANDRSLTGTRAKSRIRGV